MLYRELNENNFLNYAMRSYRNPSCTSIEEFESDLKIPFYISRLCGKPNLRERLILNDIIIFLNVFGNDAGIKILYYKTRKIYHQLLTTFLVFLNRNPQVILAPTVVPEIDITVMAKLRASSIC